MDVVTHETRSREDGTQIKTKTRLLQDVGESRDKVFHRAAASRSEVASQEIRKPRAGGRRGLERAKPVALRKETEHKKKKKAE